MLWLLLVIYQIKHFVADYPLQGKYMLGKFQAYPKFILPLLAHASVHAALTFAIAIFFKSVEVAIALALLDAGIHFVVDRIKASPDMLGRFKAITKAEYIAKTSWIHRLETSSHPDESTPKQIEEAKKELAETMRSNTFFWWSLGWDQMMHHLTHYLIIWVLVS